mmetsp:Transcript_23126/g.33032  ORF Transcript_23126/g.33032 Transcript_23126/m.33032 type:complete len:102 (+) Transcript_23126:500-805(+)
MLTSFDFAVIENITPLEPAPALSTSGVVYSLGESSPPSDGDNDGNMDGELVSSSFGGRVGMFEDEGDNEGVDVGGRVGSVEVEGEDEGDNEGVDVTLVPPM